MLEWTGERFVPWAEAPAVAYEHLHRYLWAAQMVSGLRTLDVASGEGYGPNILAQHAAFVVGLDIDDAAVRHACRKYTRPNLSFVRGSLTQLPLADPEFDVVVCFEALEHIEQQDELMAEVTRVSKDSGLFILSTPNKELYSGSDGERNPYHVKELSFSELDALLSRHFSHVQYLGQRVLPASSLWPVPGAGAPLGEFVIHRAESEFELISAARRSVEYFIAVASQQPLPHLAGTILLDDSDELGRVSAEAIAWKDEKLQEMAEQVGFLQNEQRRMSELQTERDALRERLERTEQQLGAAVGALKMIQQSRGWKVLLAARRILSYFR